MIHEGFMKHKHLAQVLIEAQPATLLKKVIDRL
jgi:hypothetical protein